MSRVVDVGTATEFAAAGLAGQAAMVTGIDNEGGLDHLPLPDDSVDVAVANMVPHHTPDPARMLAEMVGSSGLGSSSHLRLVPVHATRACPEESIRGWDALPQQ